MGSYVRTDPRAFQHTLSVHLNAVLAVEIGGVPSCADKTGAYLMVGAVMHFCGIVSKVFESWVVADIENLLCFVTQ